MPPSPFAKRGAPPTPPAGKKESAPPAAGKKESATAPSAPKIIASESDWDSSSINSETCAFDWELLNANNTDPKVETIKCLVVGDCGVGKTTLCKTMLGDDFNPDYTPTVFETYKIRAPIFRQVMVELWDMSGNPKYDKKRPVVYPNVNCFVACFDLTERESWRNVKRKWVPEMMAYPDFALFIVGCGFDRINAANASMCVQPKQVQSFLDKKCRGVFKCAHFVSTSATNGTGLERVFAGIVYATMYAKTKVSEINAGIARIKHLEFVK
jgi:small GTP-binding protein